MMGLTLEHHRIRSAYGLVDNVDDANKQDFKGAAQRFGTNILRCGLLQALSFIGRDQESVSSLISSGLSNHLHSRSFLRCGNGPNETHTRLLERVRDLQDVTTYMLITRESLAWSLWIKRAAQARIGDA